MEIQEPTFPKWQNCQRQILFPSTFPLSFPFISSKITFTRKSSFDFNVAEFAPWQLLLPPRFSQIALRTSWLPSDFLHSVSQFFCKESFEFTQFLQNRLQDLLTSCIDFSLRMFWLYSTWVLNMHQQASLFLPLSRRNHLLRNSPFTVNLWKTQPNLWKTQVWPNGPKICARRTKTDFKDRGFTA